MKQQSLKQKLCQALNMSHSSLYYQSKLEEKDYLVASEIKLILNNKETKFYCHRRIAPILHKGKNSILRVMKNFGLEPVYRKAKKPSKKKDQNLSSISFENLIKHLPITRRDQVWASDFTYLRFHGRFIYLATVVDLYTRELVSWAVSTRRNADLVINALLNALEIERKPEYFHSDQGSEYRAKKMINILTSYNIKISMSNIASPWENCFQESFYSQLKLELGNINRFDRLGELIEAIARQICFYNNERIHSAFNMAPVKFANLCFRDKIKNINDATNDIKQLEKERSEFLESVS